MASHQVRGKGAERWDWGGIWHQMDGTCLLGLDGWTGISFDEE